MSHKRQSCGRQGENLASKYLESLGYKIIASNYRTKCGEIDLIAREKAVLVFVEVKTRTGEKYGSPFEAVNFHKCRKISMVALEYMTKNGGTEQPARFDVVAVSLGKNVEIKLVKNAFDFCYQG